MKKFTLIIMYAFILMMFACASKKAVVNATETDGSTFEKAIVITETHERAGIDAEYAWIAKTYPGAKTNSQALVEHGKKPYDILHITTTDGNAMTVYFDISNFYGKF